VAFIFDLLKANHSLVDNFKDDIQVSVSKIVARYFDEEFALLKLKFTSDFTFVHVK